ncbi:hypothetical protein PF005_g28771 [Phytophthora fragariae]|uniref:RxLR effector protein n=1 Tax=Phytophthora fragariae TaxID=53985 RepID=A0A6A3VLP0_9STRA|nr:hypothetical protein PF009_g26806 [Phytophthora fragariae]KAE8970226.1 hypothetical protein PF011_g26501 [Phytophthora fragariae]KAE9068424.1 hypothetical protein PF010_g27072 [Phytophthora fragariae]KAE9079226.1 hypothetical protein PF006_g27564 [Phytophthora fragariae]KAE9079945.1 hypothetical protein PF007_g23241 [Phytophthora fragariae]
MRDWVVSFVRALIVVIGTPRASCGTPSSSTLSSLPVVSSGCCALSGNAAAGAAAAAVAPAGRRGGAVVASRLPRGAGGTQTKAQQSVRSRK